MQAVQPFANLGAAEQVNRTFDFSAGLATGETLTADSATCEIEATEGVDASASDRLLAGPTISGALVTVRIGTMVEGVTYRVRVDVSTSGGQLLSLWTTQKCVGP